MIFYFLTVISMISGFTIILEDEILYCSDEKRYNAFEIVLFVEKLLRSINPKNTWRLKKICLKDQNIGRERIIVKHIVTARNQNLFFCIVGNFNVGSSEAFKLLTEFHRKIYVYYKNLAQLKLASEEPTFNEILTLITNYLKEKYTEPLEDEFIFEEQGNNIKNSILYAGISTQGLPIISHLYDTNLLKNLEKEQTIENVELFTSELSAKLATISMNTQIRAKTKIKEIHINDIDEKKGIKIILFGTINGYSLDFIASGNFYQVKEIFKQLKSKIALDDIFRVEFSGDLKPFKHLKQYLNDVVNNFDQ